MRKIKQKVSGCFRTDEGADDFAKLHSIAETAMKNGNSKFNAILAVVQQQDDLPIGVLSSYAHQLLDTPMGTRSFL